MWLKPTQTPSTRKPDAADRDTRSMSHPWFHLNRSRGRSSSSLDMGAPARLSAKR